MRVVRAYRGARAQTVICTHHDVQALALDAGPDLDALVAVQVMGWGELPGPAPNTDPAFQRQYWKTWAGYLTTPAYSWVPGMYRIPPTYSTDMSEAWRVVDKLMETALAVNLHVNHESSCTVTITGPNDVQAEAKTMPLAICRAALKYTSTRDD